MCGPLPLRMVQLMFVWQGELRADQIMIVDDVTIIPLMIVTS